MMLERAYKVIAALRALAAKHRRDEKASVIVGYTQSYAIYVHENRSASHVVGKAGYLLDPFRDLQNGIVAIVQDQWSRGRTLAQALVTAGLLVQRESQKDAPVDTGALLASAFTRLE